MKTNIIKISTETNDVPLIVSDNTLSTTIWFSGCHGVCKNCHNLDLIVPTPAYTPLQIEAMLRIRKELTDWLVLCGGEPFWNENKYVTASIVKMAKLLKYNIFIYTGYQYNEIDDFLKKRDLLKDIDYIKCGKYIKEFENKEYVFASTNQTLHNNNGEKVYHFQNDKIINNLVK